MKINYQILREYIQQIAKKDLKVLSTSSLRLYAADIRDTFIKYISAQVKTTYNEIVDTIPEEKQMDFLNLNTGYAISMTNWINSHPMNLPYIELDEDDNAIQSDEIDLRELVKKKEVQIIGAGTALSFLLLVSGLKIWALLAESLAVAYGIYEHKNQQEETRKINLQKEQELQNKVNAYIATVEKNAMDWAKAAENYSALLLTNYRN